MSFHAGSQHGEQRVDEDLEVVLYGRTRDGRVARDAGDVDDLAVHARGDLEEAHEAPDPTHEGLGLDFLAHVRLDVRLEEGARSRTRDREREHPVLECCVEFAVEVELGEREGEERQELRAPAEQVRSAALQLARARARQDEALASRW